MFQTLGAIMHAYLEIGGWEKPTQSVDWMLHQVFNAGVLHGSLLAKEYPRVGTILADYAQDMSTESAISVLDQSAKNIWETFGEEPPEGNDLLKSLVAHIDHPENQHRSRADIIPLRMDVAEDGTWTWDAIMPGEQVFPIVEKAVKPEREIAPND
jgi:hypothetical protein